MQNKLTPEAEEIVDFVISEYPDGKPKDLIRDILVKVITNTRIHKAQGLVKQEWISVKDRLPEEFENVITWNGGSVLIGSYHYGSWYNVFLVGSPVTHWMPLPSPPDESVK